MQADAALRPRCNRGCGVSPHQGRNGIDKQNDRKRRDAASTTVDGGTPLLQKEFMSMRMKSILGAILVSATLCSASFGEGLINRMLDKCGGCGDQCGVCAACKPACNACAPAKCSPCRPAVCAKPCAKVGCDVGCEAACKPRCTPVRDMLADMKELIASMKCRRGCCEVSCGDDCCGYSEASKGSVAPKTAPAAPAKKAVQPAPVPKAPQIPKPAE
jgi:hypothetical protein